MKSHPSKGSAFITFDRGHLATSLGFSYNSIQDGLRELEILGAIQLDPEEKGNKGLLLLKTVEQFNKAEITRRLSSAFLRIARRLAKTSKSNVEE